jgi:hypothetical protein
MQIAPCSKLGQHDHATVALRGPSDESFRAIAKMCRRDEALGRTGGLWLGPVVGFGDLPTATDD